MERDEVKFVQTPFPTMGDQLAAGRVDAVVASIPFNDAIAARGFRIHDDVVVDAVRDASGGTVESAMTSVWTASRTFGREHAETDCRVAQIVHRRNRIPRCAIQAEARQMMQDWLKIPAKVLDPAPLAGLGRGDHPAGTRTLHHDLESRRLDQHRPRCERACVARVVNPILYTVDSVGVRLPAADGPRPILQDISFDVRAGEIIGIVGRSGAGRRRCCRVLGGLLEVSCGTVIFDSEVVRRPPSGAVMVFQDYGNALLPWRTVARNTAPRPGRTGRAATNVVGGWPTPCAWSASPTAVRIIHGDCRVAWRNGCRSPVP